jgi:hypothetical protein
MIKHNTSIITIILACLIPFGAVHANRSEITTQTLTEPLKTTPSFHHEQQPTAIKGIQHDNNQHHNKKHKSNKHHYTQLIEELKLTQFTFLYPVVLKGHELLNDTQQSQLKLHPSSTEQAITKQLTRKKLITEHSKNTPQPQITTLSAMVLSHGEFIPIPFQIDEFDTVGWIYIEGKSEAPVDGHAHLLDPRDEFVFMYRDTSIERFDPKKHYLPQGKILREIELKHQTLPSRYLYLIKDNPKRSASSYVNFDLSLNQGNSTYYHFLANKKNFMQLKQFQSKLGSHAGQNIFKKLHVRLSSSLFAKWARIHLNSDKHIRPRAIAVKNGPIRSCILLDVSIYVAGIRLFNLPGQINLYEQSINLPNRSPVKAATLFNKIFINPTLSFMIDFNNLYGATIATQMNQSFLTIDGLMSPQETNMNQRLQLGGWVWLNSNRGWDLFISNNVPEKALEGLTGNIIYNDTKNNINNSTNNNRTNNNLTSHNGKEAYPTIGFEISGTPTHLESIEHLETQTDLWFPFSVNNDPTHFNEELTHPPQAFSRAI